MKITMKQKKLSSEDRKAQILTVSKTLFAKSGYANVTLDAIAAQVGVSRPRIIQLFGSKRNIYETIAEIAYSSHPMERDLAGPIRAKDDFGVFKAFAAHILRHSVSREDREIFKILVYARMREDSFHRAHFQKKDTLMIGHLAEYVEQRIREGAFRQTDSRVIVFCYQAMVANLVIYRNVMKKMDFVTVEELSDECARIFLEGIKAH